MKTKYKIRPFHRHNVSIEEVELISETAGYVTYKRPTSTEGVFTSHRDKKKSLYVEYHDTHESAVKSLLNIAQQRYHDAEMEMNKAQSFLDEIKGLI